jgi:hypothetical protein
LALGLAHHVVRSSWKDAAGMLRLHRLYHSDRSGRYLRVQEPMLVAGMGLTLEAIRKVALPAATRSQPAEASGSVASARPRTLLGR